MIKIELTNMELELVKEVLTSNSVKYAYDSNVMKEKEPEWSREIMKKSDDMTKLLNKLNGVVKMKEVLIMGNVEKDFERLGITLRQTYKGADYGVCEVTEGEFKILCDEPDDIYGAWEDGGWRYCEGSNQDKPTQKVLIMGKKIIAWYDDSLDFDSEEEKH